MSMLRIIKVGELEHSVLNPKEDHYNCTVVEIMKPDEEFEMVLSKSKIDLLVFLSELQKSLRIHPPTMNDLWDRIEAYGESKWQQGCNQT